MAEKLELVMEPYDALPCNLRLFTINGQAADESDFGFGNDDNPERGEEYGCGNHCFHGDLRKAPEAMKKYNLTLEQFIEVADKLESVLHVGVCSWCV